uniref:Putative ovule protein n=1 Tax=Solanum chacoense TaxID=4108 RepID=A0A0V0HP23_SOLCH
MSTFNNRSCSCFDYWGHMEIFVCVLRNTKLVQNIFRKGTNSFQTWFSQKRKDKQTHVFLLFHFSSLRGP